MQQESAVAAGYAYFQRPPAWSSIWRDLRWAVRGEGAGDGLHGGRHCSPHVIWPRLSCRDRELDTTPPQPHYASTTAMDSGRPLCWPDNCGSLVTAPRAANRGIKDAP